MKNFCVGPPNHKNCTMDLKCFFSAWSDFHDSRELQIFLGYKIKIERKNIRSIKENTIHSCSKK